MIEWFGITAVSVMVLSYALEPRHPAWIAVFAGGCAMAAVYAWIIGSIPFVIAEGLWAVIAFRRWWLTR